MSIIEDEVMRELGEKDEIEDAFPHEHVLAASQDLIPWFTDFVNYLARASIQSNLSFHQRKRFMNDVKMFYWDEIKFI